MSDALAYWIIGAALALVIGFAGIVAAKIWLRRRADERKQDR